MAQKRGHWLVKTEPGTYSWADMLRDRETHWDGVRNYQARNNLRAMREGDHVLWYHSVGDKEVVGVAEVTCEAYPDPTTDDERWSVVDLAPIAALKRPVTLAEIKAVEDLAEIPLIHQSRLSVMPLERAAFERILALGGGTVSVEVKTAKKKAKAKAKSTKTKKVGREARKP